MTGQPMLCVFCGKDESLGPMNREDFVMRGLWEKGHRPPHVRKVPAHVACNSSFSQDNEYFRDVLAMENGAAERCEAAKKVSEGAIHRKFEHHFGSLCKTVRKIEWRPVATPSGIVVDYRPTFEVDWPRIQRVLLNVMKGIFFTVDKKPMPNDFVHWIQDVRFMNPEPYRRVISDMVDWQTFGDDAFMCRYRFLRRPDTIGMDCLMQFYRNRCFFGQAVSPDYAQQWMENMFVPSSQGSAVVVPYWEAEASG